MKGFVNAIHCVVKTAYVFLSVGVYEFAAGLIEVLFLENLVSGYHSRLFIKFCC